MSCQLRLHEDHFFVFVFSFGNHSSRDHSTSELGVVAKGQNLLPVLVDVQHSQIVAKRRGQSLSLQGEFMQHDVAGFWAFLQEHYRPTVVGSGGSRHYRQLALIGQALACVQGEACATAMEVKPLLQAVRQ